MNSQAGDASRAASRTREQCDWDGGASSLARSLNVEVPRYSAGGAQGNTQPRHTSERKVDTTQSAV